MSPALPPVIGGVREMQAWSAATRAAGLRIAFVPTMGGLHAGHLSLVRLAQSRADRVVVSVFVNPTQFGPGEDFHAYPRDLNRDLEALRGTAASVCFAPAVEEIYPPGDETRIVLGGIAGKLCGARRPGHFEGVADVLIRLFNAVLPDEAVFGQKDAQQALLVQRLVRALHFPLRIELGEIVREPEGLAMSSRNAYLSQTERTQALGLYLALEEVGAALRDGERDPGRLGEIGAARVLAHAGSAPEYFSVVDPETLSAPAAVGDGLLLVACALRLPGARLIDNHVYRIEGGSVSEAKLF